jgi:hypothetical protein
MTAGNFSKTQRKRLKRKEKERKEKERKEKEREAKEREAKQKQRDRINANATRASSHGGKSHLDSSSNSATIEVTGSTADVDSALGRYILKFGCFSLTTNSAAELEKAEKRKAKKLRQKQRDQIDPQPPSSHGKSCISPYRESSVDKSIQDVPNIDKTRGVRSDSMDGRELGLSSSNMDGEVVGDSSRTEVPPVLEGTAATSSTPGTADIVPPACKQICISSRYEVNFTLQLKRQAIIRRLRRAPDRLSKQ